MSLPDLRGTARLAGSVALVCALFAGASRADDGGPAARPTAPPSAVEADLARLDAPYLEDRADAAARLSATLPETRATLVAAFRAASGTRKAALAAILAEDTGAETVAALLDAYETTDDPAVLAAIWRGLLRHGDALEAALDARKDRKGEAAARLLGLRGLRRRARIETLFLAKKSRSGLTGYYRGQFDDLRVDREMALRVLFGVLRDRAIEGPGRPKWSFPTGSYVFLSEPPGIWMQSEIRGLAANAVGELITRDDAFHLEELGRIHEELTDVAQVKRLALRRRNFPPVSVEDELADVVLTALARHAPDAVSPGPDGEPWRKTLDARVRTLLNFDREVGSAAALCLRMGDYRKAIDLYGRELTQQDRQNTAYPYYNIACAWAMWSREIEAENPSKAAEYRSFGLSNLRRSVDAGYPDWPWMEQDRDLDALRADPRYAALLARVKERFLAPPAPSKPR